jgi:hypothetical protein
MPTRSSFLSLIYRHEYAKSKAYPIRLTLLCILPVPKFLIILQNGTTARRDPCEMAKFKIRHHHGTQFCACPIHFRVLTNYFTKIRSNIFLLIATLLTQTAVSKTLTHFSSSVFVLQACNAIPIYRSIMSMICNAVHVRMSKPQCSEFSAASGLAFCTQVSSTVHTYPVCQRPVT